ncbi:MAG: DUF86 domain-containing protein [Bacteroidales bacterium]|nr:DUF86 domain-containing protein [Bacteroidales bacterium]
MREKVRDKGRLEHISEQLNNIESFLSGKSLDDLQKDKILQYAVIKSIEIIGEAAYMLSSEFRETHPEVEWDGIIRMRHVLVHGYYQISVPLVWSIIEDDLPSFRDQIEKLLTEAPTLYA